MNTKQKAASYAFPSILNIYGIREEQTGMTLRDWFAGQALCGMMANIYYNEYDESGIPIKDCYHLADALIAEREKGGSHE